MELKENDKVKVLISENYKYFFKKSNGFFLRYGKTLEEDPDYSPFGPEIADIEISAGKCSRNCKFCYKGNGKGETRNMSLNTLKTILPKLGPQLTQVAYGITDIDANPDMWDMFKYTREQGITPNVTINGARMTPEYYDKLAKLCGAVAVSRYNPPDDCYNSVYELTSRGMKQVNIHMLLSAETYEDCLQVISDAATDKRLENLNAIVFLSLKPKGRGKNLTPLSDPEKYKKLIYTAMKTDVGVGFDSCSAPMFLLAVKDDPNYKTHKQLAEPCESYLFSIYINEAGISYPCSFCEREEKGIDLTREDVNLEAVWHAASTKEWRERLLSTANSKDCLVKGCRQCPVYKIY